MIGASSTLPLYVLQKWCLDAQLMDLDSLAENEETEKKR
jgi:hypothetical protein